MATIKVKNSAGEWETVASAEATTITNELTGEFKMAFIEDEADTVSYDLSAYIQPNENFILFFVCEYDSAATGANPISAYLHLDDYTGVTNLSHDAYYTVDSLHDVFEVADHADLYTYDEDTRIFKFNRPVGNYNSVGGKAILFYTGIKEA